MCEEFEISAFLKVVHSYKNEAWDFCTGVQIKSSWISSINFKNINKFHADWAVCDKAIRNQAIILYRKRSLRC